jgi:nucleoside-diphosphate-sugar epimerase
MHILIIGGTRNMGLALVNELSQAGHRVTVFNRGKTPDSLPDDVERLRGDRTDPAQLQAALAARSFDAVVDMVLYKGNEAETITQLLNGRTGHYIFVSTGQVYLVRQGIERPFSEDDYAGRLMPAPKLESYGYAEWLYGKEKRDAEDALARAWESQHFPYTSLRLPMVNSPRDHFARLYGYILRLQDGGPILVPETPDYPLRHVYADDVVRAIKRVLENGLGKGRAFNLSQDETVTLDQFLHILGDLLGAAPTIVHLRRSLLEANGFLPDCSPFSDRWMSELDNIRSKAELGVTYTPLRDYVAALVNYYAANPLSHKPVGYRRRPAEISFALSPQE